MVFHRFTHLSLSVSFEALTQGVPLALNSCSVANILCAQANSAYLPSAKREMSSSYGYGVKA